MILCDCVHLSNLRVLCKYATQSIFFHFFALVSFSLRVCCVSLSWKKFFVNQGFIFRLNAKWCTEHGTPPSLMHDIMSIYINYQWMLNVNWMCIECNWFWNFNCDLMKLNRLLLLSLFLSLIISFFHMHWLCEYLRTCNIYVCPCESTSTLIVSPWSKCILIQKFILPTFCLHLKWNIDFFVLF